MRVGVLALQGGFAEHAACLARLGAEPVEVRLPCRLAGLSGLIIPGGESTTIGKLMERCGLMQPLHELALAGLPIWGTCAGMILLARGLEGPPGGAARRLPVMDIVVRRNAFGRQLQSFETDLEVPEIGREPFRAIFIRAPLIVRTGQEVRILARLPDGRIVAAEQGNILATAFHPELAADGRFHGYFLEKIRRSGFAVAPDELASPIASRGDRH